MQAKAKWLTKVRFGVHNPQSPLISNKIITDNVEKVGTTSKYRCLSKHSQMSRYQPSPKSQLNNISHDIRDYPMISEFYGEFTPATNNTVSISATHKFFLQSLLPCFYFLLLFIKSILLRTECHFNRFNLALLLFNGFSKLFFLLL